MKKVIFFGILVGAGLVAVWLSNNVDSISKITAGKK